MSVMVWLWWVTAVLQRQLTPHPVGCCVLSAAVVPSMHTCQYVQHAFSLTMEMRCPPAPHQRLLAACPPKRPTAVPLLWVTVAVTSHSQPTPKAFNFKLSPGNADVLQQLCLGFVATANNHVLDYGQPGLKETNEVSRQPRRQWRLCFPQSVQEYYAPGPQGHNKYRT